MLGATGSGARSGFLFRGTRTWAGIAVLYSSIGVTCNSGKQTEWAHYFLLTGKETSLEIVAGQVAEGYN